MLRPSRWPLRVAAALGLALSIAVLVWFIGERDAPTEPNTARVEAAVPSELRPLSGTFQMGSTADELTAAYAQCRASGADCGARPYDDEELREVTVGPFLLDPMEVTVAEFAAVAEAQGTVTTAERAGFSTVGLLPVRGLTFRSAANPSEPVRHVSQSDAAAYCAASKASPD